MTHNLSLSVIDQIPVVLFINVFLMSLATTLMFSCVNEQAVLDIPIYGATLFLSSWAVCQQFKPAVVHIPFSAAALQKTFKSSCHANP